MTGQRACGPGTSTIPRSYGKQCVHKALVVPIDSVWLVLQESCRRGQGTTAQRDQGEEGSWHREVGCRGLQVWNGLTGAGLGEWGQGRAPASALSTGRRLLLRSSRGNRLPNTVASSTWHHRSPGQRLAGSAGGSGDKHSQSMCLLCKKEAGSRPGSVQVGRSSVEAKLALPT